MNISYLISVLDLYLEKEKDLPLMINVFYANGMIKIDFSYNNLPNKTYVKLKKELFFEGINYFINDLQKNLEVKNEEYNNNDYNIIFSNDRKIMFHNFSLEDLKIIRDNIKTLNDFNFNQVEVKEIKYNDIYKENKTHKLSFQMGFTTFITIFLSAIWFLDILLISLWIFKSLK